MLFPRWRVGLVIARRASANLLWGGHKAGSFCQQLNRFGRKGIRLGAPKVDRAGQLVLVRRHMRA